MTRLVHVEWEDACSHDPWTKVADLDQEPRKILTAGFLVRVTPKAITVASTHCDGEDVCCFIVIPRAGITKISEVTIGAEISLAPGLLDHE